jgi:hypothetical protein
MICFEELYKRYSQDVFRFALYLCGNRAEAEDIVSVAFVRLWTAAEPMNITRNVIQDLLPVYFAGEASPDTKQLVEDFFRGDPEFARMAQQNSRLHLEAPAVNPAAHAEAEALFRTKRAIRQRSWLMAFAIFCTLVPFTVAFDSSRGLVFFMWRDAPALAMALQVAGIGLWIGYFVRARRLRRTSL